MPRLKLRGADDGLDGWLYVLAGDLPRGRWQVVGRLQELVILQPDIDGEVIKLGDQIADILTWSGTLSDVTDSHHFAEQIRGFLLSESQTDSELFFCALKDGREFIASAEHRIWQEIAFL